MTSENTGIVSIRILAGRNLKPMIYGGLLQWGNGTSNPFCVIQLDNNIYRTSTISDTLQPTWDKEEYMFPIRMPNENETNSYHYTIKDPDKKKKLANNQYIYQQYCPQLFLQVYHDNHINSSSYSNVHDKDKNNEKILIGNTYISILQCILQESSSHRQWYSIYDPSSLSLTHQKSSLCGEILISMQYDVQGLDPIENDIIKIIGFGGIQYYSKIIPINKTLKVINVLGDQILAKYTSNEKWDILIEIHRNLIHVIQRPSILRTAKIEFQAQITKIQNSKLITSFDSYILQNVPKKQRNQLVLLFFFSKDVLSNIFQAGLDVFEVLKNHGIHAGIETFTREIKIAYHNAIREFQSIDWAGRTSVIDNQIDISNNKKIYYLSDEKKKIVKLNKNDNLEIDIEKCPTQLICPITGCPMIDPVVAADGHTYEKSAIEQWFSTSSTSPMTGINMKTLQLFPNYTLKKLSDEFMETQEKVKHMYINNKEEKE